MREDHLFIERKSNNTYNQLDIVLFKKLMDDLRSIKEETLSDMLETMAGNKRDNNRKYERRKLP